MPGSSLSDRTKAIIILAVTLCYALIPVDLVPDAMVGLGQVDDAIVFALGVFAVVGRLRRRDS